MLITLLKSTHKPRVATLTALAGFGTRRTDTGPPDVRPGQQREQTTPRDLSILRILAAARGVSLDGYERLGDEP